MPNGVLLVVHGHNEDRRGQWVVTTLTNNMIFVYPESFEEATVVTCPNADLGSAHSLS